MKNYISKIFGVALSFFLLLGPLWPAKIAYGGIANWQKGASIQSNWNEDFSSPSFKQSVDNLAATNANYVSLVFRVYQSNTGSTDIQTGGDTPTDSALASAIDYIHSKGMKVMLKPHLESWSGEWRANINPSDRQTWFTNYGNMMARYAQIAKDHGVEDFCVGTELIKMAAATENSGNTQNWKDLIARIRGIYGGKLTYGANWGSGSFADEKNNIQFWDSLDYIGISAYFNLWGDNSVNNLKAQWDNYNNSDIRPLSQRWNKPVVFTEVGYKSVTNAHTQPWDPWFSGPYDGQEQANAYQALFDYWSGQSFMQGVHWWDWNSNPNAGWPGDTGYTPQHKPAQDVMTQWFGLAGSPTPPPGNTATFTATASANPSQVSSGQNTNVAAVVTANGGQGAGIIVDVEIYNSAGQRVKQQVFENQMFNSTESKTFNVGFAPPANDVYKIKIGVFNYNWSQLYIWNDNAGSFGSSGGGSTNPPPPPPPANAAVNIWWPTNGATVGGAQPFKAMVDNLNVSQYQMYWQVDGGGLVLMWDDSTDYPHKQFDADLSGWNWRGSGPYRLNFVAKDLSGNTIVSKAIDIFISY